MKKELNPIQIIKNKLQRRNALPDGNSLCYKGELDGHFQIPVDVYVADLVEKSQTDFSDNPAVKGYRR